MKYHPKSMVVAVAFGLMFASSPSYAWVEAETISCPDSGSGNITVRNIPDGKKGRISDIIIDVSPDANVTVKFKSGQRVLKLSADPSRPSTVAFNFLGKVEGRNGQDIWVTCINKIAGTSTLNITVVGTSPKS